MSQWSGLAPAVDAHLERWQTAERGMVLVRPLGTISSAGTFSFSSKTDAQSLAPGLMNDWVRTWMLFASSYGIPDDDGIPQASMGILDGSTIAGREQMQSDTAAVGQGLYLCHREHKMLRTAISHYVSAEVCDLISEASEEMDMEPLFHTDLFTPNGFVVFEKPIVFDDLDPHSGKPHPTIKVAARAMGWCYEPTIYSIKAEQAMPGISLFIYTSQDDYQDYFYRTSVEAGHEPPYDASEVKDGLIPFEVLPWCFGMPWGTREEIGYTPGTVPEPIGQQRRWFLTFMRFMWQEIIMRHPQRLERPVRRRWERAGRKDAEFVVLRLRRITDPFYRSEGTGVGLDKRIKVRGHWRRQYFPSLGHARHADGTMNPASHRLVWIDEHWRGPEDGPLGPLHHATSVVR